MEEVRQLIFPGFRFGSDDPEYAVRLTRLGAGGFCIYRGKAREVAALARRLQAVAETPLLLCGDYEDGTASQVAGGTALPSNMGVGASRDPRLAYEKARITAAEARALGVRWVFAPVLDLAVRPENPIVNVRSFGSDPALAARMGRAYMRGLKAGGVLSTVKHFPGHGDTSQDSHLTLPTVDAGLKTLLMRDVQPFYRTAGTSDSLMMAHLNVPVLGDPPGLPASLSIRAVRDLLRKRLGYRGLVLSDALDMRAVARRFGEDEAAVRCLRAGSDILLVPKDPERLLREMPRLVDLHGLESEVAAACRRLGAAKRRLGLFRGRRTSRSPGLARVGCRAHRVRAARMAERCLAWAVPPGGRLPFSKRFGYLEPQGTPCAPGTAGSGKGRQPQGGRGRLGAVFVRELGRCGVRLERPRPGRPLLLATFLSPRAYSGRIRLTAAERRRAASAVRRASYACAAAFGSPFELGRLPVLDAALCAFSVTEDAQRAAARALAGRLAVRGTMPVDIGRSE